MECACDFDPPEFYIKKTPKANKTHKCHECGSDIGVGEVYENVSAKWDGYVSTIKTCPDCVFIRKALDEIKCFCWSHGGLMEDVQEQLSEAYFEDGERFFYLRILASHRNRKRQKLRVVK